MANVLWSIFFGLIIVQLVVFLALYAAYLASPEIWPLYILPY